MVSKGKRTKAGSTRPLALFALVIVLLGTNIGTIFYFMFYRPSMPFEDVPMTIADVTSNPADYVGKVITITGYYIISAGYPMLVESLLSFLNNSLQSYNFVLVTGEPPASMEEFVGYQCDVKGTGEWADETDEVFGIIFSHFVAKQRNPSYPNFYRDAVRDTDYLTEHYPLPIDFDAEKYAVLYSGGIDPYYAHYRYWNDISYMYFILLLSGYSPDHIYVVYKDGVGENPYPPVNYAAKHASLNAVFSQLSSEMGARDTLFFYTTNHGGNNGIEVWYPMDYSRQLTQTEVSDWLDSITCDHMIIVMEQCVSGKFISYISAPNRVILTACSDGQSSYSCDTEGEWDEFVYHFMSGIIGTKLPGGIGDADADYSGDGKISMREAFMYAAIHDSCDEIPLYNDNGDGGGLSIGPVVFGTGFYGDTIFL
jgi:hypothetical protein